MANEFKPKQKVTTNRAGTQAQSGVVVAEHPGSKGSFFEVKLDDGKVKRYRAAHLLAA